MPPLEMDDLEEDTEDIPPLYMDDSDEDTGYGENEDSDNQERHGSLENVSGNHNWEIETFIRNAFGPSATASSNLMKQLDLCPPLSQEGCEEDQ